MADEFVVRLSSDEHHLLVIALGLATGTAMRGNNRALAYRLVELANAVNRDNPRWTPYCMPQIGDAPSAD